MNHNNLDDQKFEDLLKHAPKLSDHRSKSDVLKRLQEDARLKDNSHIQQATTGSLKQDEKSAQKTEGEKEPQSQELEQKIEPVKKNRSHLKKKPIWIPTLVGIASLFLFFLLVKPMLFENNKMMKQDSASSPFSMDRVLDGQENAEMKAENKDASKAEESSILMDAKAQSFRSSVYEEDITGATVFRIGMASHAAASIPITFIIPQERIASDFPTDSPTGLQLYEKYATQIDEQLLGFQEYHPYKGTLEEHGETIVHKLPTGHQYDVASGALGMYIGSLKDTFSNYKEIIFENEDGSVHEFSQAGEPSKPLKLNGMVNHYNYFLFTEDNGMEYLTPNFNQTYESVSEALNAMKSSGNDIYQSVIPENVEFTVREEDNVVVITFEELLNLETLDAKRATQMIEAFSLTAASFNKQVRLENVVQESWEGFEISQNLPMPVGPNKNVLQ